MADLLASFEKFKTEIDHHVDRREKLIKISRDVTALSKKLIFTLHRVPILPILTGPDAIPSHLLKELQKNETAIHELLSVAANELSQSNAWRYQRNISPGIQEFVESLTFKHYLQFQTIPTFLETQRLVTPVALTPADYVLGIADLTGELSRRAIAALAHPASEILPYTHRISHCLRSLTIEFEGLDLVNRQAEGLRELGKKVAVMQSSLRKVEIGVFEKTVRGKERPDGWVSEGREQQHD